jgi:hypothetical protein
MFGCVLSNNAFRHALLVDYGVQHQSLSCSKLEVTDAVQNLIATSG